jgi:HIRAN domain
VFRDVKGNPVECVRRFNCNLVGLTHPNKRGENRMELIRSMPIGTELTLVPEPGNAADRNAILVYRADDPTNDLGYMHAIQAKQFSPLIERGATFSAQLNWINRERPDYLEAYFYVFQLTPPVSKSRSVRRDAPHYDGRRSQHSRDESQTS